MIRQMPFYSYNGFLSPNLCDFEYTSHRILRYLFILAHPDELDSLFSGHALDVEAEHSDMIQTFGYLRFRINSGGIFITQKQKSFHNFIMVRDSAHLPFHNDAPEIRSEFIRHNPVLADDTE